MMRVEEGAEEIVDITLNDYQRHFGQGFPLYEHIDKTRNDQYDISLLGAKKLQVFIEKRIKDDEPVRIPEGYEDRVY